MKNRYIQIFSFLVVLLSLATFSACEEDDKIDFGKHTKVTTATVTQITGSSAVAGGNVMAGSNVSVTERGVCIATISNPTTSNTKVSAGSGAGSFTCNLTNLQPNTTYYVRAYAIDSKGTAYGEELSFTTAVPITLSTVTTAIVSNVTENSVVAGGNVISDGNASVTERGVCIATVSNPTTSNTKITSGSGTGSFTCNLTNLQPNTTYYVRAYAINSKGTAYGAQVSFTTQEQSSSGNGTEGTHEYVDLGLSVKWATMNVGASKPEDYGDYFAWGETQPKNNYGWIEYKWCNGSSSTLTKYNTNSSYGTTTLDLSDDAANANWGGSWRMPTDAEWTELRENCTWTWTTQNAVNGYRVTSKSNGNSISLPAAGYRFNNKAGSDGSYWSSSLTTDDPSSAWSVDFNSSYVYRNNNWRSYGQSVRPVLGESVVETTIPTVTTTIPTQITEMTAVAGGNVTSDGGATVTEHGVVYAITQNPTINNTKVTSGIGTGSFTCNLTDLQPNTKYYVRAYAVNSQGTAYGEEVSFTTNKQIVLPSVITATVTQITETTAVAGGNVTSDGGVSVTERGVVYATTQNPTTNNTKVTSGTGTGSFTCNLTDLQSNTKYYVRAYAINEKGTAYGEEVTFTTNKQIVLPTVTTSAMTQITESSAVAGGNVTSDGNASVTERGVVYSTNQNPTTTDTKVAGGSGVGEFTCNLTDLQSNTKYYVRAYAINEKGTAYGEEVTFTTNKQIVLPTVTTSAMTQITESSAVAGGNVTSDGNTSVTERGVCIATVTNPTTSNTKVSAGSGTGSFTCNLTNLQPNTTYYVRAYATNEVGTAYGEEMSFTTETPAVPEYVDLGLSVKWATFNVGASKPEDNGDYFAWGETEPKDYYDWSTYKWCNGSYDSFTKYNTSSGYGTVDNKTILEATDDAATANWGGSWRMPTKAEQDELRENCTWTWTTQNGVNGYRVTSKSNGNSIFLPAAGGRNGGSLYSAGSHGYYRSSSLGTDEPSNAYILYITSSGVGWVYYDRYYGHSVRPVCP